MSVACKKQTGHHARRGDISLRCKAGAKETGLCCRGKAVFGLTQFTIDVVQGAASLGVKPRPPINDIFPVITWQQDASACCHCSVFVYNAPGTEYRTEH